MGTEAKAYLQEHAIPQLFEGLMTGLIYNRPADPITFLECALQKVRDSPDEPFAWDMFIYRELEGKARDRRATAASISGVSKKPPTPGPSRQHKSSRSSTVAEEAAAEAESRGSRRSRASEAAAPSPDSLDDGMRRVPSVIRAAEVAVVPDVPIVLFMGGPGGGKTRIAARVYSALAERGLVHVCMPDIVRNALAKYKDKYPDWKEANDRYLRGELIPNHLALALVKAEMARHPDATAFFLEGFPREARQVEDFEREVRTVNMAMILDYDERTLREHMERRGLGMEIVDQKIKEFKQKTLPSAKYFDDQKLLHLIPGEKDEHAIYERMRSLVVRAMESGVPVINSHPPSAAASHRPHSNGRSSSKGSRVGSDPHSEASSPTARAAKAAMSAASAGSKPSNGRTSGGGGSDERSRTRNSSRRSRASGRVSATAGEAETNEEDTDAKATINGRKSADRSDDRASRASSTSRKSSTRKTSSKVATDKKKETEGEATSGEAAAAKSPEAPSPAALSPPPAHEEEAAAKVEHQHGVEAARRPSQQDGAASHPATPASAAGLNPIVTPLKNAAKDAPVILIIGAPGSNKCEYARRVAARHDNYVLLSMGEMLRKQVQENRSDELWERVADKMNGGEPVPIKLCRELLYAALRDSASSAAGFIVEGFPRTQSQLVDFESVVGRLDVAVLIDCTEQFCVKTVQDRYAAGVMTKTERADDAADVLKTRLGLFKQNTLPMLKALDDRLKLRVVRADRASGVDGDASDEKIFADVILAIENALGTEGGEGG